MRSNKEKKSEQEETKPKEPDLIITWEEEEIKVVLCKPSGEKRRELAETIQQGPTDELAEKISRGVLSYSRTDSGAEALKELRREGGGGTDAAEKFALEAIVNELDEEDIARLGDKNFDYELAKQDNEQDIFICAVDWPRTAANNALETDLIEEIQSRAGELDFREVAAIANAFRKLCSL